jgi:hypothetical protein
LSLGTSVPRLFGFWTQITDARVEEWIMTPNRPYDEMSILGFQVSMLSLAAALDAPTTLVGEQEMSAVALAEAERLKRWAEGQN